MNSSKGPMLLKLETAMESLEHTMGLGALPFRDLVVGVWHMANERAKQRAANPEVDLEEVVGAGGTPVTQARHDELLRMIGFADMAYEPDTLRERLDRVGFTLISSHAHSEPEKPAHFLAFESGTKTAILGIRGTSTIEDAVTDLVHVPVPFAYKGAPVAGDMKVHDGLGAAAAWVVERHATVLKELLSANGYKVVVVGHSLGAATASLASVLLREAVGIQDLRCYAFATPPCCDEATAREAAAYVTSVVNADDVITRCSMHNGYDLVQHMRAADWKEDLEDLTEQLVAKELAESTVGSAMLPEEAKAKIMAKAGGLVAAFLKDDDADDDSSNSSSSSSRSSSSDHGGSGKKTKKNNNTDSLPGTTAAGSPDDVEKLFVPGEVAFYFKVGDEAVKAAMVDNAFASLRRVETSATAGEDHFLDNYLKSLRACADPDAL
eukprot:g1670.t1